MTEGSKPKRLCNGALWRLNEYFSLPTMHINQRTHSGSGLATGRMHKITTMHAWTAPIMKVRRQAQSKHQTPQYLSISQAELPLARTPFPYLLPSSFVDSKHSRRSRVWTPMWRARAYIEIGSVIRRVARLKGIGLESLTYQPTHCNASEMFWATFSNDVAAWGSLQVVGTWNDSVRKQLPHLGELVSTCISVDRQVIRGLLEAQPARV